MTKLIFTNNGQYPDDKANATTENTSEDAKKEQQEKTKALKAKLSVEFKNIWDICNEDDRIAAYDFAEEYKKFLDIAKTEREAVITVIEAVESLGYEAIDGMEQVKPGDKVYKNIRGKGVVTAVIGSKPLTEGLNLVGAHIDAPRLDLKPIPVYEENDMVFLKTHYYGGIKKYQWAAIPLAIHGVVVLKDGSSVTITVGENADDPVLTITDLLPHLGQEQMSRKANEVIKGEDLNVLIGSLPYPDPEASGRFKLAILQLLNERYGIVEKDLVTAELEIVPAYPARDVGLDASMIGAYAQDDRVCAFTALAATCDLEAPERTSICLLFDKEEIGSEGNTGAQSRLYENFMHELLVKSGGGREPLDRQLMLENSKLLSADVTNAFDPNFASVSDPKNNSYMGKGICLAKYVGSRGKSGTSDANSEFFAEVVRAFEQNNVAWQTGEMGKVDQGGGGTIAKYLANLGMEVIDCGVPVLSMHSPFEITSKIDVYYTYLAYKAFFENIK
ncbi:MAG: aminopeptidase [Ruminococcaceae bacterium]|nr:aminopeptidase [Oscillospiraceae bacterium]